MRVSFGLSVKEIENAVKEIRDEKARLQKKCEEFSRRLAREGVNIANAKIGKSGFGKYIHIASEIEPKKAGCRAIFYMEDAQKIVSQWQNQDGVQSKEISPSLMLEFGAGLKAQNPAGIPGVGTGTYGEHGDEPGWWYMDLDGQWHYASGVTPKMPMYHAAEQLSGRIAEIAREVFT